MLRQMVITVCNALCYIVLDVDDMLMHKKSQDKNGGTMYKNNDAMSNGRPGLCVIEKNVVLLALPNLLCYPILQTIEPPFSSKKKIIV